MTRLARPLFGLCALAFLAGGCADLQSARGTIPRAAGWTTISPAAIRSPAAAGAAEVGRG